MDNQNSNQTQTVENALPQPPVSPIEQTPSVSQPKADGPLAQKPKSKFLVILIAVALFLVILIGTAILLLSSKQKNETTAVPTQKTVIKKNLNPNTGNLYDDVKVRLREELK